MDPIRFFVSRPYTVAVGVILAVLFSVLAYRRIPVQLKPTVDQPTITVRTEYRGAGPVEVEEQITRPIEDLLQSADGLEELRSSSIEGVSTVMLEYQWGVDKSQALIDVINKLSELQGLPPDAERPVVSLTGMGGENASMWIVSESPYDADRVRQIVSDEVEPQLERVEGVADLMIVGGEEREIRVHADPERLSARSVTFEELGEALRRSYLDQRGGTIETGTQQFVVRTEGRSEAVADLENIVVRRDERGTVHVRDVAAAVDGYRELASIVRGEGRRVVAIGVRRESGANVVRMIDGVERELEEINERFADRGLALRFVPVYRDTTYLREALDFVWGNLWLGAALAIGVLLVFLRSIRSVLVIALSIPISLVTVFLVMDALGRTLNVISLAGLAFASGMVVDNAIVVLENTFRHMEMGKKAREAAMDAGREVWGGVLASTLTTMVVFIPIFGIQEEAGQLFADIAIAIAAAVGLSLIVALTVVPCLASLLYRNKPLSRRAGEVSESTLGPLGRAYGAATARLTAGGGSSVLLKLVLVGGVMAGTLLILPLAPDAGYLPAGNANLIFYFGQPVPGTRPEAVEASLLPLESWIRQQPETERYFMVVAAEFNGGGVILKDAYSNAEGLDGFLSRFFPQALAVPGFRFLVPMRFSLFQDSGKQFTVEVTGPDLAVLAATARELEQRLSQWPGVQPRGVQTDYQEGRPELHVRADHHLAAEAGMSVRQVAAVVESALAGRRVATFSDGGRDHDVVLVVPQERVRSREELAALPLFTPSGARTTLGALAAIEKGSGPVAVNRLERERAITLTVNLLPEATLQTVLEQVEQDLLRPALERLPSGYDLNLGGSADKFSTTLRALTSSFWLAILITYLLLVALFQSWVQPFAILVTVPLAMSGGLLGIILAHRTSSAASFDLLAMLGFIILAGIVVNNAILIVHQSNNLRAQGVERRRALSESAKTRLRPILMTVVTTVFGMLPLALGRGAGAELYQGLAAVITGGLILSTIFTLFVIPAIVSLGWDLQDTFRRRAAAT
ncbi:MAG: efflux RND transporter permease subunit [Planctomycetota bacterium]|nr:MAG: efflux RND transporter permease subunit [Planctomycetota bacterium]